MSKPVQKTHTSHKRIPATEPLLKMWALWAALVAVIAGIYVALDATFITLGIENRLTRSLGCTVNEWITCEPVYASESAYMLGIPVAAWGAAFYFSMLVLTIIALINKKEKGASAVMVGIVLSILAVLFSMFKATQLIQMGIACPLCIGMYVINGAILVFLILSLVRTVGLGAYFSGFFDALRNKSSEFTYQPAIIAPLVLTLFIYGFSFLYFSNYQRKQEQAVTADTESETAVLRSVQQHFKQDPLQVSFGPNTLVKGNKEAKVSIIEFADFQCPACKVARDRIESIVNEFGKYVNFRFQNYPLDNSINPNLQSQIHSFAGPAAKAFFCAANVGKGWEMHKALFDNQEVLGETALAREVQNLGLDTGRFNACMTDPATIRLVQEDIERGKIAGVNSTPSVYINGRLVDQWGNLDVLRRIVREELSRAGVKK
ncbi:MAG: thioredoxin domain-containing protein [Bacteroidetes Order II. Incertae sedis bacterium]|nr:thioredoxin domain-containing protein [Bacteroidetes Order II. bacterium]